MTTMAIVGASLAGAKAAEGLRDNGYTDRLVLIGEETERPYERPPLSKGYLLGTEPREKAYVHEATWYSDHDVELLLGVRATNLDPASHTLTLDGYEPLRYDRLLLATGSRVRQLTVPGTGLSGVRYLRTLPEADILLDHVRSAANVVVIGAGRSPRWPTPAAWPSTTGSPSTPGCAPAARTSSPVATWPASTIRCCGNASGWSTGPTRSTVGRPRPRPCSASRSATTACRTSS